MNKDRFRVSGFRCQGIRGAKHLYETTQNGVVFLVINLVALALWLNSEPQNIEYRTAECRRVESLRSIFL
jgi:hypothetical protein